jgi:hypothetical protein
VGAALPQQSDKHFREKKKYAFRNLRYQDFKKKKEKKNKGLKINLPYLKV